MTNENLAWPESFKLKAMVQKYELSVSDLKEIFSQKLGVPAARITIKVNTRDVSQGSDCVSEVAFDGLTVTVRNT